MGLALNLGMRSKEALKSSAFQRDKHLMFPSEPCGWTVLLAGRWPSADALAPRGVPSQGAGGLPGLPALQAHSAPQLPPCSAWGLALSQHPLGYL